MSLRWCVAAGLCWAASVAPTPVRAQNATAAVEPGTPIPPAAVRFRHHKKLTATYDTLTDSTRLAVVTHKGKYFLTVQRPRLTWSVAYPGRTPSDPPPGTVLLEFRTQNPQVALDSRLVVTHAGGRRLEVASAGAFSDPGVQTWSHFMRFAIPAPDLAEAVATDAVSLTVGGISERLDRDQINALRDLLARVGAWPGT